jgi:hypothetical protein
LILTLTFSLTLNLTPTLAFRLHRVASAEASDAAERVQYDLLQLEKKAEQKQQKLERQIREQEGERERFELLRGEEQREIYMSKRQRDKEVRQLSIDRVELERQRELTVAQGARVAHDRKFLRGGSQTMKRRLSSAKGAMDLEKKVSFFLYPVRAFAPTRDSLIPLPI